MLKLYRNQQLNCFTAEVFMCQHHTTGNGLGYWNLRLLCEGTMIDAFHWDRTEYPNRGYRENDWVLVGGRWITKSKKRFQIIQSTVVMRIAAKIGV